MPQVRNTYGDRALDQEFDLLIKRIKDLEARLAATVTAPSVTNVTNVASVDASFLSITKWDVD